MRTAPAPGSDPTPGPSSIEPENAASPPDDDGNDVRLRGDVPPHY